MPKKCPNCGRFMFREIGFPSPTGDEAWSQFVCANEDCYYRENPIPAPEYDYEYWGLSAEELARLETEAPAWAAAIRVEQEAYQTMLQERRGRVF